MQCNQHVEFVTIVADGTVHTATGWLWKVDQTVNQYNVLKAAAVEHNGN
jgi:hypothetical protein